MDVEKVIEELEEAREYGSDSTPWINEVLDNAINTIRYLEEQNKWHVCSEELPNESGEYLCYMNYDGNKFYNIEEIDCDGFFKEWNLSGSVKVIAWRELPKFEGVE